MSRKTSLVCRLATGALSGTPAGERAEDRLAQAFDMQSANDRLRDDSQAPGRRAGAVCLAAGVRELRRPGKVRGRPETDRM